MRRKKTLNDQMPTFLVVGSAKCGTTSLHSYLDLHPEVSMSSPKDPRYFCRHVEHMVLPVVSDRNSYLRMFAPGTLHRGDSSTAYSSPGSHPGVPAAISREIEHPKFVFLVRDPIDRLVASVQQMGTTPIPSRRREYADAEATGSDTLRILAGNLESPGNWHVDAGRYMTQINRFLEHFPKDSILVIDSENLRFRREETVNRVFEFLDLAPLDSPEKLAFEINTASERIRDADLYLTLARSPALRRILNLVPRGRRRPWISHLRNITGTPITKLALEPEFRLQLEDLYRPEVEALRDFTGEPFSTWSI
ncbi:MAG: sulfotransferase domain-containing protein [Solirubrobacterales bacterium]